MLDSWCCSCFLPNWQFPLFRISNWQTGEKLMQKSGSQCEAICWEDWENLQRLVWERVKVEQKSCSDRFCASAAWLVEPLASLRLLADRQIVGGRRARPSRPGRPRRPSRPAAPPTTKGSRRRNRYFGGPGKCQNRSSLPRDKMSQPQTSNLTPAVRVQFWRFFEVTIIARNRVEIGGWKVLGK